MKNLLLLLLLLPALAAAKVPDEEDIQNKTMDAESPFYYPSLMMRYNAGDETLTDEDYHYLYYGYNRMQGVIRAIRESGDALTQKTPRHILMFDHALDVMATEGLSYDKSRIISRTVEFIPLTVPYTVEGKKRKGLYYDFGRIYWNKPEGYTYKRDRTWQFNNLKPRTYK